METIATSTDAVLDPTSPEALDAGPNGSVVGNRRRMKKARVRVTRACDRCKKRKTKCTGCYPCRLCIESSAECTFNSTYSRGRQSATDVFITHSQDSYGLLHADSPLSAGVRRASRKKAPSMPRTTQEADHVVTTEPVSRASPEPSQTDQEGHYVGPSSGVAFLSRVQKRLEEQSVSLPKDLSVFNFGDAPLPYHSFSNGWNDGACSDALFPLMLSQEETTKLVQRYFDFAVPVDRFLHQPTIEKELLEFYETRGTMSDRAEAPGKIAVLFMVFAIAQEHMVAKPTSDGADISNRCFLAANQQLSKEQGAIRLTSLQARLCQCLWLLSQSRINHCWSLFGTVARLSIALGLHRNRRATSYGMSPIELECRRRTFWSAYSLDNYLSTALGRPRTFNDDDIDQELPSCINDADLHLGGGAASSRSSRGQSVMLGPVAYGKLSRILSGVLKDIYSIRPVSMTRRLSLTDDYMEGLHSWRTEMSRFLDPDNLMGAPLIPIFQRQRNVLNLAYWHTIILANRPLLLSNFAKLTRGRRSYSDNQDQMGRVEKGVQECLNAAMKIVGIVDEMIQAEKLFRAFWFTPYFAFSASVILLVYTIQHIKDPEDTYREYLAAAEKCQQQISGIAESGSLTSRYCLVLEELRLEARRRTNDYQIVGDVLAEQGPNGTVVYGEGSHASQPQQSSGFGTGLVPDTDMALQVAPAGNLGDFHVSPSDSIADLTSWGHFDSMVISGLSHLDNMFGNPNGQFLSNGEIL